MVEMLIMRGARINVMNRGDDTPLHLAASHGHRDIVQKVRANPCLCHLLDVHGWSRGRHYKSVGGMRSPLPPCGPPRSSLI